MELLVSKLEKDELEKFIHVIRLFEDVFEMKNFSIPPNNHLKQVLARENFFVFAASLDGGVVGGLTVHVLQQYYSQKPLAYIYDLAVAVQHQRKGIGRKLIAATNEFCEKKGFEEVFVQADKVDDYAIDFYRSTRPTNEEEAVHFSYVL